jgi:protoheme IX farnesyltransferase
MNTAASIPTNERAAEAVAAPADLVAADVAVQTVCVATPERVPGRLADLIELTKPRLNFLVLVTTLFGFYMASAGPVNWLLLLCTLVGTALTAGAASALNQVLEGQYDAQMRRTAKRPVAAGRVSTAVATLFGVSTGLTGVAFLALTVNLLTAGLGLATLLLYVLVYTPLKRVTTLNTLVGAVPGAIPPLMGFTAVTDSITPAAMGLFWILFVWQMPHFLAIAILCKDDYAAAGFKMLPCNDPALRITRGQILLFNLILVPVSLLPSLQGIAGGWYTAAAVLLGVGFLACGWNVVLNPVRPNSRRLFFASIIYLPLILAAMTLNKLV